MIFVILLIMMVFVDGDIFVDEINACSDFLGSKSFEIAVVEYIYSGGSRR